MDICQNTPVREHSSFVLLGWIQRVTNTFRHHVQRQRARRQMAQLDDRMARDIGLSPAELERLRLRFPSEQSKF